MAGRLCLYDASGKTVFDSDRWGSWYVYDVWPVTEYGYPISNLDVKSHTFAELPADAVLWPVGDLPWQYKVWISGRTLYWSGLFPPGDTYGIGDNFNIVVLRRRRPSDIEVGQPGMMCANSRNEVAVACQKEFYYLARKLTATATNPYAPSGTWSTSYVAQFVDNVSVNLPLDQWSILSFIEVPVAGVDFFMDNVRATGPSVGPAGTMSLYRVARAYTTSTPFSMSIYHFVAAKAQGVDYGPNAGYGLQLFDGAGAVAFQYPSSRRLLNIVGEVVNTGSGLSTNYFIDPSLVTKPCIFAWGSLPVLRSANNFSLPPWVVDGVNGVGDRYPIIDGADYD